MGPGIGRVLPPLSKLSCERQRRFVAVSIHLGQEEPGSGQMEAANEEQGLHHRHAGHVLALSPHLTL